MAHGASVRIQTLGDLVAHDYVLCAMCERCRHRVDLDMQALAPPSAPAMSPSSSRLIGALRRLEYGIFAVADAPDPRSEIVAVRTKEPTTLQ
jgi:hypothetical protein